MPIKTVILCVLIATLSSGCSQYPKKDLKTRLVGTWRLYDLVPLNGSANNVDGFTNEAELKTHLQQGELLCFFPDQVFTDVNSNGGYRFGKWEFSKNKHLIHFQIGDQKEIIIRFSLKEDFKDKQVLSLNIKNENVIMKFIKESEPLKKITNDPFYTNNNIWRIKPKESESPIQLVNRFDNYLKHVALILKASEERKQDFVSFEFSKGPVKIYSSGIGAHPYSDVPENWKNSFFNEDDASKAYSRFENYLYSTRYKGAGTGNWVEDDYNILLSIYAGLEQSKTKQNFNKDSSKIVLQH